MNNLSHRFWFQFGRYATCLLLTFSCLSLSSQTLSYDCYVDEKKVGWLKVVKEVNDEAERITLEGAYRYFQDSLIDYQFESYSVYMDGALIEAESHEQFSDGEIISMTTVRQQLGYVLKRNYYAKTDTVLAEDLYGFELFYFEEPKRVNEIYSPFKGRTYWVEQTDEGQYRLTETVRMFTFPKMTLTYEKGTLREYAKEYPDHTITFKLVR